MSDVEAPSREPLIEPQAVPVAHPLEEDRGGGWRDGFFDLHRNIFPTCLLACLFPILLLGKLADSLSEEGEERAQTLTFRSLQLRQLGILNSFSPFASIVSLYFLIAFIGTLLFGMNYPLYVLEFFVFGLTFYLRQIVRQRYHIPGEAWMDCLLSYFGCCQPCVIAQMSRHVLQTQDVCDCSLVRLQNSSRVN